MRCHTRSDPPRAHPVIAVIRGMVVIVDLKWIAHVRYSDPVDPGPSAGYGSVGPGP